MSISLIKINLMNYINRSLEPYLIIALSKGKSILLSGASQTGKTTLINNAIKPNITYSFDQQQTYQYYEKNPHNLEAQILAITQTGQLPYQPIIAIDGIQKIPAIIDIIKNLITKRIARFVLTTTLINDQLTSLLTNNKIICFRLMPLSIDELLHPKPELISLLLYGSLPKVIAKLAELPNKNQIVEEICASTNSKNTNALNKFIELTASTSGEIWNFKQLASQVDANRATLTNYCKTLVDLFILEEIEALSIQNENTKRKLSKSIKYLFYDLGIRRIIASEGTLLPQKTLEQLFKQFITLEFIRKSKTPGANFRVFFWCDHSGPEVDIIIEQSGKYVPISISWNTTPSNIDYRYLKIFQKEYKDLAGHGFVVCQTLNSFAIDENITAIPWQEMLERVGFESIMGF